MKSIRALCAWVAVVLPTMGCTWETKLPDDATAIHVERGRELVITDDAVLRTLSSNADDGPLGFRRAMDRLPMRAPSGGSTLAWMRSWSQRLRDEGESARADALDATITCPWLRRTPANLCDASCVACAATELRLEESPFRLIAVANRTDLSVMPDRAADGGEGRLVFALTDGPADAPDSHPLPFTVIIEYAQIGSPSEWARRWHTLGASPDAAFPTDLANVAGAFVEPGSLAQIRTADAVTGALVLHEFRLDAGQLVATTVRNTPNWMAVSEADVRTFAAGQANAITEGTYVLPKSWLASSSALRGTAPSYLATVANQDALVHGTCGGCHQETARGFQIDPLASGDRKLSRFLIDPKKDLDEVGRRTQWMQMTLSKR